MIDFFAWITTFSIELLGFLASLAAQEFEKAHPVICIY